MSTQFWIGYLLIGGATVEAVFGLRLFVWARRQQQNIARQASWIILWAAVFSAFSGLSYLLEGVHLPWQLAYRGTWTGWLSIGPGMTLALELQDRKTVAKHIGRWSFIFWSFVACLCMTTDWIEGGAVSLHPFVDVNGPLERPVRVIAATQLVVTIVLLAMAHRRTSGAQRQRIAYLLLGTGIYAGLGGISAALLPAFGIALNPGLAGFFSWPWVGLTFYSVTRYRLFDFRVVLSKIITAIVSTMIFGAIHLGVFGLLTSALSPKQSVVLATIFTAILIFSTPLSKYISSISSIAIVRTMDTNRFLRDSTQALISVLDLDGLLRHIVQLSSRQFSVQQAGFYIRGENGFYERRSAIGSDDAAYNLSESSPLLQWMINHHEVFVSDEAALRVSSRDLPLIERDASSLKAGVVVPIVGKDGCLGFLCLGPKTDRGPFLQADVDLLTALAAQIVIAMENVRLFREAITDGLTGLYHQKHFMHLLDIEFNRARRHGRSLAVLFIDIDHFKSINDRHGHLAGNEVLRDLAQILVREFRKEDIVARYGGEEFAALLTESTIEGSLQIAERLRKRVELVPAW